MARFSGISESGGIPQIAKIYPDYNTHNVNESWNGKHIYFAPTEGNWDAIFIPDDASLNLPIGFTFTIITDGSYIYLNVNDTDLTYLNAVSVPYTTNGYDIDTNTIVTVIKVDENRWFASGYGITQD